MNNAKVSLAWLIKNVYWLAKVRIICRNGSDVSISYQIFAKQRGDKKKKRNEMHSSSNTVFIFPALCVSMQTANYFLGYCDSGGYHGCIFRGFSQTVFMMASRLMVVLMAVERFVALRYPFKYQHLMSKERVIGAVAGLGLYAVCTSCTTI